MPQEYLTSLLLVGGLITGFLTGSVSCLYAIRLLSAPPKAKKNKRERYSYLENEKKESEEERINPLKERLPAKDRSWSDMHCRKNSLDRTKYLQRAMSAQEAGYKYRVDKSTDSFVKGSRYDNDRYASEESLRNIRNTEQTLIEMAIEANRQLNNQ